MAQDSAATVNCGAINVKAGAVFNDDGNVASDFRVEANGEANLFFCDGGEDKVYIGGNSKQTYAGGYSPRFQIEGTGDDENSIGIFQNSNSAGAAAFIMGSSRGTSVGSNTIVQDDDMIGQIMFCGADGTDRVSVGGHIRCFVDGTPGSNDLPSRLVFSTTADGAADPTERMRIDSVGDVTVATGDIVFSTAGKGICLGVTSNTDSNTLDDYEEGTFTPIKGANTDTAFASATGFYTKIGDTVFFDCKFTAAAHASNSNRFDIYGLPFTSSSTQEGALSATFYTINLDDISVYMGGSRTFFYFVYDNGSGSIQDVTNASTVSKYATISGHYRV
jgi:hypothetical protein